MLVNMFHTPPRNNGEREEPIEENAAAANPNDDSNPSPDESAAPSGKLASVTRKQNEINNLLIEESLNIPRIKEEYGVYLKRVENLFEATTDKNWLQLHKPQIDEFRRKIDTLVYPTTQSSNASSKRSGSSNSSSSIRMKMIQQKAKALARQELLKESASIRERELKLKARYEEENLQMQIRREELETQELLREAKHFEEELKELDCDDQVIDGKASEFQDDVNLPNPPLTDFSSTILPHVTSSSRLPPPVASSSAISLHVTSSSRLPPPETSSFTIPPRMSYLYSSRPPATSSSMLHPQVSSASALPNFITSTALSSHPIPSYFALPPVGDLSSYNPPISTYDIHPSSSSSAHYHPVSTYPSYTPASSGSFCPAASGYPPNEYTSSRSLPQQNQNIPNSELTLQHGIARAITQVQLDASLPKKELQCFDGSDITKYKSFIINFDRVIGQKCEEDGDKLLYLQQYAQGEAKKIVDSCVHYNPRLGYEKARRLLEEEYGNEFKIANAYIAKLEQWPNIRSNDAKGMSDLSFFLMDCQHYLEGMTTSNQMENPKEIKHVVNKLPIQYRERWRRKTFRIIETYGIVHFRHLVEFVREEAAILKQPLYGDLNDEELSVKSRKSLSTSTSANYRGSCNFCQKTNHDLSNCFSFEKISFADKSDFVKKQGLCFGCLKGGHLSKDCKARSTCSSCNRQHPTIMHSSTIGAQVGADASKSSSEENTNSNANTSETTEQNHAEETKTKARQASLSSKNQRSSKRVVCPYLPVKIRVKNRNQTVTVNCALDQGSTDCWINEDVLEKLGLKPASTSLKVSTMQSSNHAMKTRVLNNLQVMDIYECNCVTIPVVYSRERKSWPYSNDDLVSRNEIDKCLHLKDVPFEFIDEEISLLIGMNVPSLLKPMEIIDSSHNEPYAARHLHGWTFNGPVPQENVGKTTKCHRISLNTDLVTDMENFLSQDFQDDSTTKSLSISDKKWIDDINSTMKKLPNNHIQINLPLKKDAHFPNNRNQAYNMFTNTLRRLKTNNALFEEYDTFMNDTLRNNYAEKIPESELITKEKTWYITHHGVRHKTKKKLRVVFNCSLKCSGTSLNDQLRQGPDLANSLTGVLMRFRQEKVAVIADIKQMFYQIRVPASQSDLLRFFWVDSNGLPTEYRLLVHVFGATSSPSVANFALKSSVTDVEENNITRTTILNNFYVDDLLSSFETVDIATQVTKQVTEILHNHGFTLTSFDSNFSEVLERLDETTKHKSCSLANHEVLALGITWNKESDELNFRLKYQPEEIPTKRELLRYMASIYDPIGAISPALLVGKRLFQNCCAAGLGWDDLLPEDMQSIWKKWIKELEDINMFKLGRCFKISTDIVSTELHLFSDGAETSYGSVAYVKMSYKNGDTSMSLVASKSRLTPLNNSTLKTVPRIELCAAKLTVELAETIKRELTYKLDSIKFWSDSTTVLGYIKNEDLRFHRFVENKINFIRNFSNANDWSFVSSRNNPADIVCRGASPKKLASSELWREGPQFLRNINTNDPQPIFKVPADDPEIKRKILVTNVVETEDPTEKLIKSSSSWYKLKVKVSWFMKLKKFLLKKNSPSKELTLNDIQISEHVIISYLQRKYFSDVFLQLANQKPLSKICPIRKLNPFLASDGLIRVGGRISNAQVSYHIKHPIVLPFCDTTELIVKEVHSRVGHMGRTAVLSMVRQKYWIVKGGSMVKKVLRECIICLKSHGRTMEPKMADLPERRVSFNTPPFTHVATDYFGPFFVTQGRTQQKRYGVIFTCMAIRAVHIEISHSLSTDSFIQALRRFISRRGNIKSITSDNGTNFVGACRELKKNIDDWNQTTIAQWCKQNYINWHFNPPYGSHFGGVFERQIRSIRKIFSSVLTEQVNKLKDEDLVTLMCEIEAVLNNRPITELSSDPQDLEALTPNHLLLLNAGVTFPPGIFSPNDNFYRNRWKQTQHLVNLFWTRWSREYLTQLQERQKWTTDKKNCQVGDLVLVKDLTLPRNMWPLGRISEVFFGSDGIVRSAKILIAKYKNAPLSDFSTTIITRPVVKLIMLIPYEDM